LNPGSCEQYSSTHLEVRRLKAKPGLLCKQTHDPSDFVLVVDLMANLKMEKQASECGGDGCTRRGEKARRDLKSGAANQGAMMRKLMDPGKATKGTVIGSA
jgi:hypothetical protein